MEVDISSNTEDQLTGKTVEAEDDDEEEEFLIMADIGHDIDQQTVLEHSVKSEIRAIDIDGTNPFIQIGPYTFQGQYNYILGTNLFFSTSSSAPIDDNASTSSRTDEPTVVAATATTTTAAAAAAAVNNPNASDLNLIGMSDKKLTLSRVYVYPKKTDDADNHSKS